MTVLLDTPCTQNRTNAWLASRYTYVPSTSSYKLIHPNARRIYNKSNVYLSKKGCQMFTSLPFANFTWYTLYTLYK